MQIHTSTQGLTGLPRYFQQVFSMAEGMKRGRLDVTLPDGRVFRAEGPEPGYVADLQILDEGLFGRILREGDLGFADAYLDCGWTTSDLQAFMDLIHDDNEAMLSGFPGRGLVRAYERMRFWLQSNSKRQARKNISHHYDLGNAFYGKWLDDTMTYSSALFTEGQQSLEVAQTAKYAQMVDEMGAVPGDHVLEIGCGWGGFAEYAAKVRGLKVTGLTISEAQREYAVQRMVNAGLSEQVEIKLCDYRDEEGTYDGIASIEMFEAVGEKYWPVYFNTVRDRLKPGKCATFQIITVEESRFETYRKEVDFIQKYIFPGGLLPSPGALRKQIAAAGLDLSGSIEFGESYSVTLRRWYETFNAQWDDISQMGFDDRFRRMWNYYLTSCAATFQTGVCDVTQITVRAPVR